MQHDAVNEEVKEALRQRQAVLDPVALLHTIREAQSALMVVCSPQLRETPQGESLDRFLARLPSLWRQGEARPTHAARVRGPRHWRTRKDPFEGVWCDVLAWLQENPDATAGASLARLRVAHPGRYTDAQLRTLQRRVQQWRGIMAKKLVYGSADEAVADPGAKPDLALVGSDPKCQHFGNILQ